MRPDKDTYFLNIAKVVATRGTCAKKQVGCVLVDAHGHILATGYNGQPRGHKHCTKEDPCPAFNDPTLSCNAIHAENNALMQCSDIEKVHSVYITEPPCMKCKLLIDNVPWRKIITPVHKATK
jgi:dCMP deaminase